MYLPRALEGTVQRLSQQFPALLLTGARQVGKTTLLRKLAEPDRTYVSLDDPALRDLANQDPRLFLQRYPPPALIDEVQLAPSLFPLIKIAIDERRRPGAFWLTGSQQFAAMKGMSETLAGRVAILPLHGLSVRERLQSNLSGGPFLPFDRRDSPCLEPPLTEDTAFDLIWRGAMPELTAQPNMDREVFLRSYIQTYLQRDVRELTQVGNLDAFTRFLRACAARTAQLLNLSELARDVDISVPTAKAWLSVLEASFQIHLLRPYHSNLTKRLLKTPKLYMLDTGLCSYLTGWSTPETLAHGAMAGAMFETHAIVEILKSWWHHGLEPPAHFYRDRDQREVDLLLEVDGELHGVEVKRSATVRREWVRTFAPLSRLGRPLTSGCVVSLSPERLPLDAQTAALPVGCI